jgi:hypothetical protein
VEHKEGIRSVHWSLYYYRIVGKMLLPVVAA